MDSKVELIEFYRKCDLQISEFLKESESEEYKACRFKLNGKKVISRRAKITPKKLGQFVTCWKRSQEGITVPLDENDDFDFLVIWARSDGNLGQFVFPKSTLIARRIITIGEKDGKRGFRVYPIWDSPISTQALKAQKWQLQYFSRIKDRRDCVSISQLFGIVPNDI